MSPTPVATAPYMIADDRSQQPKPSCRMTELKKHASHNPGNQPTPATSPVWELEISTKRFSTVLPCNKSRHDDHDKGAAAI